MATVDRQRRQHGRRLAAFFREVSVRRNAARVEDAEMSRSRRVADTQVDSGYTAVRHARAGFPRNLLVDGHLAEPDLGSDYTLEWSVPG